MKKTVFLVVGVSAALAIAYATYRPIEVGSESFQTFAELKASGLVDKGWVPEFVPADARSIDVSYNLDTNRYSGAFLVGKFALQTQLPSARELPPSERSKLLEDMAYGGLRSSIRDEPIYVSCRKGVSELIYVQVQQDGRVVYWNQPHGVCVSLPQNTAQSN